MGCATRRQTVAQTVLMAVEDMRRTMVATRTVARTMHMAVRVRRTVVVTRMVRAPAAVPSCHLRCVSLFDCVVT